MKVAAVLLAIACGVSGLPAKLGGNNAFEAFMAAKRRLDDIGYDYSPPEPIGYSYDPPAQPSGLYEVPAEPSINVEVTTSTTTPPPPSGLYGPPDRDPEGSEPEETIVSTPKTGGTTTTMMPMPYNIDWGVRDEESGNMFNHVENSDGKDVTGEYSVLLPDGRMQIVRFRADPINGYQAEVIYEPAK